ncbi:MAG: hypothetical protein JSR58_05980 [Verrucomicrobia bacterium]|nr:hypothetical protein [Verrucomicrobiota bacterium]
MHVTSRLYDNFKTGLPYNLNLNLMDKRKLNIFVTLTANVNDTKVFENQINQCEESIEELEIHSNHLNLDFFSCWRLHMPHLKTLKLSHVHKPSLTTSFDSLQELTSLALFGCGIDDSDLMKLQSLKSLKFLDLFGENNITPEGLVLLLQSMPQLERVVHPGLPEFKALRRDYPVLDPTLAPGYMLSAEEEVDMVMRRN